MDYTIDQISLRSETQLIKVKEFLYTHSLEFDSDVDFTVVARRKGTIVGTCSKAGNIIKSLAVETEYRGEGVSTALVQVVIDRLFEEGHYQYFVFTQPNNTCLFRSMNFNLLYKGEKVALLESGINKIDEVLQKMKLDYNISDSQDKIGIVMNCNPFTLGHLHLIETASKTNREVLVFIVEENRSLFTFKDRIQMVKSGTKHLNNVIVMPGTKYIISNSTFPSYFLREPSDRAVAFMKMDGRIFGEYFAKKMGISERYVGDEPFCELTRQYNRTLHEVLSPMHIKLTEITRLSNDDLKISASNVRDLIKKGSGELIKGIVPKTTFKYIFETDDGRRAVERIINSDSLH